MTALAKEVSFTAAAVDPSHAYLGHKVYGVAKGEIEFRSSLVEVPLGAGKARKVPLPVELRRREICGVLPLKGALVVLSQLTAGDAGPVVAELYAFERKEWKRLGTSSCTQPTAFEIRGDRLKVLCREPRLHWEAALPLGLAQGDAEFKAPQFMAATAGGEVSISAEDPTQATVQAHEAVRLMKASSFE